MRWDFPACEFLASTGVFFVLSCLSSRYQRCRPGLHIRIGARDLGAITPRGNFNVQVSKFAMFDTPSDLDLTKQCWLLFWQPSGLCDLGGRSKMSRPRRRVEVGLGQSKDNEVL
jgi:hypothetical protein